MGGSRAARPASFLRLRARARSALGLLALLGVRELEVDAHAGGAGRSVTGKAAGAAAGLAVRGPRLRAAVPEALVLHVLAPVAGHRGILPVPRSSFFVLRGTRNGQRGTTSLRVIRVIDGDVIADDAALHHHFRLHRDDARNLALGVDLKVAAIYGDAADHFSLVVLRRC